MSHILLIDDDKGISEVMSILLGDLGHSFSIINSFEDLKRTEISDCDLIFLDGNIGASSGQEISKYIKKHPVLRNSTLIIFSADDEVEQIAQDTNAQGVLRKPFEIGQLEKIISAHSHR